MISYRDFPEEEKKKHRARALLWQKNHPERAKEKKRKWYLKNRERMMKNSIKRYRKMRDYAKKYEELLNEKNDLLPL